MNLTQDEMLTLIDSLNDRTEALRDIRDSYIEEGENVPSYVVSDLFILDNIVYLIQAEGNDAEFDSEDVHFIISALEYSVSNCNELGLAEAEAEYQAVLDKF